MKKTPRESTLISRKRAWGLCTKLSGSQQMVQSETDQWGLTYACGATESVTWLS